MLIQQTGLANIFAFIALILYILTLAPTMLRIVAPTIGKSKALLYLTRRRRQIGILAWVFAFIHGTIIVFQRQLSFTDPKTYLNYFQGLTLITIFTLLAITSNDFSKKKLKRHWKTLHNLTWVALFLLPWHILDKMKSGWSIFTAASLGLILVTLYFLTIRIYKKISVKVQVK